MGTKEVPECSLTKKEVQDRCRWPYATQEKQLCEEKLMWHPAADGGELGWLCCCSGVGEFRMRVGAALVRSGGGDGVCLRVLSAKLSCGDGHWGPPVMVAAGL